MTTQYSDDFTIPAEDFERVPAGTYRARVHSIDPFDGRDFVTGEPKPGVKFTFEITEGDWAGEKVDRVMSVPRSIVDDRAIVHKFYKGITGVVPVAGGDYKLRRDLVNKECMIVVEDHTTAKGSIFPRVVACSVIQAPRPRKAAATPVVLEDAGEEFPGA